MTGSPDKTTNRQAFTLVELLASMAVLSVLMVMLGLMLESSLKHFRGGAERLEQSADVRVVAERMERDLVDVFPNRIAALPHLPDTATKVQREFFGDRLFLPFELDRQGGTGIDLGRGFANSADGFSSIAFATCSPNPAIVGYYVAYARHSPLAGDDGAGMKLFRHHRRGGHPTGEGYADRIVRSLSAGINDAWTEPDAQRALTDLNPAPVRRGKFANSELPFIFSSLHEGGIVHPWPALPAAGSLHEAPPTLKPLRGSAADWLDPDSPVHDSVFPDEAVCDHIVRFRIHPWRVVRMEDGSTVTMDAVALNAHLGLEQGDEWPVLVTPDLLDVDIAVIPEATARRLTRAADWVFDWNRPDIEGDERLRGLRTHRFRIHLPLRDS